MTKFWIVAAVLVCVFTLSTARLQPGNDKATKIRLHSFRITLRSKSPNRIPLIAHSFRPINRRFAMIKRSADLDLNEQSRLEIPIGFLPHRDCNEDPTESKHVEISCGNDMLVASSENDESNHVEISNGNDMLVASSESDVEQVFEGLDPLGHSIHHLHHDEAVKDTTNRAELLRRVRGHRWDNMLKKMDNHNKIQIQSEKKREGERFMNRVQEFLGQYF